MVMVYLIQQIVQLGLQVHKDQQDRRDQQGQQDQRALQD
jgi:hypothetical protein